MARMRRAPGACLRILNLHQELEREPASRGLQRLVRLVGSGKLTLHLGVEADWREIGEVAQALLDRRFPGKAAAHLRPILTAEREELPARAGHALHTVFVDDLEERVESIGARGIALLASPYGLAPR